MCCSGVCRKSPETGDPEVTAQWQQVSVGLGNKGALPKTVRKGKSKCQSRLWLQRFPWTRLSAGNTEKQYNTCY